MGRALVLFVVLLLYCLGGVSTVSFPFVLTQPDSTSAILFESDSPDFLLCPKYKNGSFSVIEYWNITLLNISITDQSNGTTLANYTFQPTDAWSVETKNTSTLSNINFTLTLPIGIFRVSYYMWNVDTEIAIFDTNATVLLPAGTLKFTFYFLANNPFSNAAANIVMFIYTPTYVLDYQQNVTTMYMKEQSYITSTTITTMTLFEFADVDNRLQQISATVSGVTYSSVPIDSTSGYFDFSLSDFTQLVEYDPNFSIVFLDGGGGSSSVPGGAGDGGTADGGGLTTGGGGGSNKSLIIGLTVGLTGGALLIVVIVIVIGSLVLGLYRMQKRKVLERKITTSIANSSRFDS